MRSKQVTLLACGVVLVVVLFAFATIKPPKEDQPANAQSTNTAGIETVDFALILEKAKTTLPELQLDSVSTIELQLKKVRGETEKERMLESLAVAWEKTGNILVAGYYYAEAGLVNRNKALLEKASALLYSGFPATSDSLARRFGAQQAINVFRELQAIDSSNLSYAIREAICYIDGLGNVMQGVTILKMVEEKDPDNKEMNLILGRLAIVSGQYDKAIARLEKLSQLDPGNAEVFYHLADAYTAVGRKDDAIKSLEQCKKLVDDPDFDAQIDNYIEKLK